MRAPEIEEVAEGESPEDVVLSNARAKARAVAAEAPGGATVIAADTEVFLDGRALGKPRTPQEARGHLEALSGRAHDVWSGLVVLGPEDGRERSGAERSEVAFRRADRDLIEAYLASGEWGDRAGGYAIQGLGSAFVTSLAGDLSNVIGLPIRLLLRLAPEMGEKSYS